MCISQKMCTGHHWFDRMVAYFPVLVLFLLGQSPRGEGSLGFFLAAARLQGWSTKGKLQLSCLLRDLLDKCSTELNEPGCHREALYFGSLGTNAWQTLAFRNLNHTTRNPAKLIDKISFANARRTGQLVEAPWQIQGTNRVTQTTVFGNRLQLSVSRQNITGSRGIMQLHHLSLFCSCPLIKWKCVPKWGPHAF